MPADPTGAADALGALVADTAGALVADAEGGVAGCRANSFFALGSGAGATLVSVSQLK